MGCGPWRGERFGQGHEVCHHFSNQQLSGNFVKNKVYYSKALEGTLDAWGHTGRSGIEKWRKRVWTEVLPLLASRVGYLGFHRFIIGELKTQE